VYVANEVRVGSLYRSVPQHLFDSRIRRLFFDLQAAWGGVPFEVVNDGEVTALAAGKPLKAWRRPQARLGLAAIAAVPRKRGRRTSRQPLRQMRAKGQGAQRNALPHCP
jgi:hypothetical protein